MINQTLRQHPRLGLVGPMLGSNPGWVITQGEIMARLFAQDGYDVDMTSRFPGRARRVADTLSTIAGWRNQVDLVIHNVFSGSAFGITDAASALCRALGLPQLFVLRGGSLPEFTQQHPDWVGRVFRRADAIVAPSFFLAQYFDSDPVFTGRIRVIPNIIDLDQYPYRHRASVRPRLLWMRTFHEIYNPLMAVDALVDLQRTHPEATLTMAGQDKGLLAATEALVGERGLGDMVHFAGFLDLAAKQRKFGDHDIYLHTNHVDNMPVSVVEAAAFGLPVVATRVGGIPYLLEDEQTGLLVEDGDAGAMAGAIRRLLDEPDLADRLSSNGRRLAEMSAWLQVRQQWETLFSEILPAVEVAHA